MRTLITAVVLGLFALLPTQTATGDPLEDSDAFNCAIHGNHICGPGAINGDSVPLHCWGSVILDGSGRVEYWEGPQPTKRQHCTDDGLFTPQEQAAMNARNSDHYGE